MKPTDAIEDILVRDFVDSAWEASRWRRLRVNFLSEKIPSYLRRVLAPLVNQPSPTPQPSPTSEPGYRLDVSSAFPKPPTPAQKLTESWVARDPAAIERVNKLLKSANITFDSVYAPLFIDHLTDIERIDRFIMIAEGRRNSVLREIDRRRAALAQMLRGTVKEIEDAEFKTIDQKAIASKNKNAA